MGEGVGVALAVVFLALAGLHVYWALGGRWGAGVAIPEIAGRPAFVPGRRATLVVAALLGAAAALVASRSLGMPGPGLAAWLVRSGTWVLSAVFALRALGDLRTFGLLKVASDTAFARYDTWLYSPLCAAISVGCAVVALDP